MKTEKEKPRTEKGELTKERNEKNEIYYVGVEREGLRCTKDGKLATTPFPEIFGDRMKNNFITTDFGEEQMELRTSACKSTEECYNKLDNITDVVLNELNKNNELLWAYSMPCILPEEKDFIFGNYGEYKEEAEYEKALYKKYGYKMHCMSGIHVNFSINKKFYNQIRKINDKLPVDMDDAYFKIMRQFMKKAWLPIYFLGATPLQCENDYESCFSIRNTNRAGFTNRKQLKVDFSNKTNYINSIKENIADGTILTARELYVPIRAKSKDKNNLLDDLEHEKISHIEVRLCDINPFDKCGVSKLDLDFVVLLLFYCLFSDDEYELDYKEVAEKGLSETSKNKLLEILKEFEKINKKYNLGFKESISKLYKKCEQDDTKAEEVRKIAKKEGSLKEAIIKLSTKYSEEADEQKYFLKQYPNLQASTVAVIKDAITMGIDYNVINEKNNFVEFIHGKHTEYVIEATRTNKDSYIFPYITDDKYFAKEIMAEHGINVPEGILINKNMNLRTRNKMIKPFIEKPIVVKPRTTNCGIGITVFPKKATEKQLNKAIEYAFKFDTDILIENYVKGYEYRFVVINGKCLNIVWRRSASVLGDGKSTILELIKEKDKESWHRLLGNPMVIDQPLKVYLNKQGYTLDYVPEKNERVFLRANSNCSTGGESVDVTDIMPKKFKDIAEKAAKLFKAKICGVDILIEDIKKDKYSIIEINDNPGICINEWPYEGKGEKIGMAILEILGYGNKKYFAS